MEEIKKFWKVILENHQKFLQQQDNEEIKYEEVIEFFEQELDANFQEHKNSLLEQQNLKVQHVYNFVYEFLQKDIQESKFTEQQIFEEVYNVAKLKQELLTLEAYFNWLQILQNFLTNAIQENYVENILKKISESSFKNFIYKIQSEFEIISFDNLQNQIRFYDSQQQEKYDQIFNDHLSRFEINNFTQSKKPVKENFENIKEQIKQEYKKVTNEQIQYDNLHNQILQTGIQLEQLDIKFQYKIVMTFLIQNFEELSQTNEKLNEEYKQDLNQIIEEDEQQNDDQKQVQEKDQSSQYIQKQKEIDQIQQISNQEVDKLNEQNSNSKLKENRLEQKQSIKEQEEEKKKKQKKKKKSKKDLEKKEDNQIDNKSLQQIQNSFKNVLNKNQNQKDQEVQLDEDNKDSADDQQDLQQNLNDNIKSQNSLKKEINTKQNINQQNSLSQKQIQNSDGKIDQKSKNSFDQNKSKNWLEIKKSQFDENYENICQIFQKENINLSYENNLKYLEEIQKIFQQHLENKIDNQLLQIEIFQKFEQFVKLKQIQTDDNDKKTKIFICYLQNANQDKQIDTLANNFLEKNKSKINYFIEKNQDLNFKNCFSDIVQNFYEVLQIEDENLSEINFEQFDQFVDMKDTNQTLDKISFANMKMFLQFLILQNDLQEIPIRIQKSFRHKESIRQNKINSRSPVKQSKIISKNLKSIYNHYCKMQLVRVNIKESFESYQHTIQNLKLPEFLKLCQDFDLKIDKNEQINKQKLISLFKLASNKFGMKYKEFKSFVIHISQHEQNSKIGQELDYSEQQNYFIQYLKQRNFHDTQFIEKKKRITNTFHTVIDRNNTDMLVKMTMQRWQLKELKHKKQIKQKLDNRIKKKLTKIRQSKYFQSIQHRPLIPENQNKNNSQRLEIQAEKYIEKKRLQLKNKALNSYYHRSKFKRNNIQDCSYLNWEILNKMSNTELLQKYGENFNPKFFFEQNNKNYIKINKNTNKNNTLSQQFNLINIIQEVFQTHFQSRKFFFFFQPNTKIQATTKAKFLLHPC